MALALFDLDNTLLDGDSDYLWGCFLVEHGIVDREHYESENQHFYDQYLEGSLDIYKFLRFQLKPLATHKRHQLEQQRLGMSGQSCQARMAAKQAEIQQLQGLFELRLLNKTGLNEAIPEFLSSAGPVIYFCRLLHNQCGLLSVSLTGWTEKLDSTLFQV